VGNTFPDDLIDFRRPRS